MSFETRILNLAGSGAKNAPQEIAAEDKIRVQVMRVKHYSKDNGFFIVEVKPLMGVVAKEQSFMMKGTSVGFVEDAPPGVILECLGVWTDHPTFGRQFDCAHYYEHFPDSLKGLEYFLSSGRIPNIGPVLAKKMLEKWGMDCIRILQSDFKKLVALRGFDEEKARNAHEVWVKKSAIYEIVSFIGAYGVGERAAAQINATLKKNAVAMIMENPYILMRVEGIGFKTADKVAMSLGMSMENPLRLRAALQNFLDEKIKNEGNTAILWEEWIRHGAKDLRLSIAQVNTIAQELLNDQEVIMRNLPFKVTERKGREVLTSLVEKQCITPKKLYLVESSIAKNMKRIIRAAKHWDLNAQTIIKGEIGDPRRNLDASQVKGAITALAFPMSILTGGPGTGKTTTLKTIVQVAKLLGQKVVLAAPTARAAKRMKEAIGEEALTIHRCLCYAPNSGFAKNESNQLEGDLFIIDEVSMMDTYLMAAWLKALPSGARVLFVGDADQLTSVGVGDVLRDFLLSNVIPASRLSKIYRTKAGSQIAENAALINQGLPPSFLGDLQTDDYVFIEANTNEEIVSKMLNTVAALLDMNIASDDIQILSPQQNGLTGTTSLNQELRWLLNPLAPEVEMRNPEEFYDGERYMQLVNNYDLNIFNGDMCVLKELSDGERMLETEVGNLIPYDQVFLRKMSLGYAISVHKAQGGERPIIIIPVSRSHLFTLNRNLLYTAVTRGQLKVIVIGDKETVTLAAQKKDQQCRLTGLMKEMAAVGLIR